MIHAGGVADVSAAPFAQDGSQCGGVVVIGSRAADQDVAAAAGLKRRLPCPTDQDVSSLTTDEPIRAAASHEHIIGNGSTEVAARAGEIQDVVIAAGEEHY